MAYDRIDRFDPYTRPGRRFSCSEEAEHYVRLLEERTEEEVRRLRRELERALALQPPMFLDPKAMKPASPAPTRSKKLLLL